MHTLQSRVAPFVFMTGMLAYAATASGQPVAPPSAPPTAPNSTADIEADPTAVEPQGAESNEPVVIHTPINQARADKPLVIAIEVDNHGMLTDLSAIVRAADGSTHVLAFERKGNRTFEAQVSARLTAGRTFGYAIVSTDRAGVERKHFASLKNLHPVDLYGIGKTAKLRRQLARYNGKRNEIRISGEVAAFGSHRTDRQLPDTFDVESVKVDRYSDNWQHYAAEWVYRPLTWLHDIRIRAGYMRASAEEVDNVRVQGGDAPGLNYGSAEANFELHRWFSLGGRFVLGANEDGFVTGIGLIARVGDMTRTHLAVDYETIQDVGSRTDLRLHWTTLPRFPMALGVTFTTWPDEQSETANMLSYDLGMRVGESTVFGLRAGVANRPESFNTGFTGGVRLSYGF